MNLQGNVVWEKSQGRLNTIHSVNRTPWKRSMTYIFFLFVSLSRCDSFCTLIFHFSPQPRSSPLVRSVLYVGNIAPITQILSKFTQDSRFQFHNAINLFQPVVTSLHQFYQASVLTPTWCHNIWFKVMTAISKPTVPRTPPPKVSCVEIDTALVTKCLSLIPSDMIFNVFLCVLALRALLPTGANIEMLKENMGAVWGPPPHLDFLFRKINVPCCSPPEALFTAMLLFSNSLCGPVVPGSRMRTDYTPARHCSEAHSGFALSGRALIITVQKTSNTPSIAFDGV